MANYASAEDDAHSYAADGGGPAEDPSEPGECVEQAGVVFAGGGLSVPQHHERTKTDQKQDRRGCDPEVPAAAPWLRLRSDWTIVTCCMDGHHCYKRDSEHRDCRRADHDCGHGDSGCAEAEQ